MSESLEERVERMAREHGLGETGAPNPVPVVPGDRGQLKAGVVAVDGQIVLSFGAAVSWLSMSPAQARLLAEALRQKADAAEGKA